MTENERKDQRLITIARVRAGMSMDELGERMWYTRQSVYYWEHGQRKAPWEDLYIALPELKVMKEKGCAAVCDHPRACLGGVCPYFSRKALWKERAARGVEYHAKNCG